MQNNDFTNGKILSKLLKFMLPVLFAMFLQAMYGAVDLLVVGRFGLTEDVSAVSTGSQFIMTITFLIVSFAMGVTVMIAQRLGEKKRSDAISYVGSSILLFFFVGVFFSVVCLCCAPALSRLFNAPKEAFALTVQYIRICGGGFVIISAYNLLGAIFRGYGDSKTPLIAVGIACLFNIVCDYVFVAIFHLGAAGAALATVLAQLISVILSLYIIRKSHALGDFTVNCIAWKKDHIRDIFRIGAPMALQDFMVSISFLVLMAIVNKLGLIASAAIGVAEKVTAFIMLVPSAFMQSMSSFVAQNKGAGLGARAKDCLKCGIAVSTLFGITMFFVTFFFGNHLAGIFTPELDVITSAFDYLKAYAIDCLLTCFLFCFIGYYTGMEHTTFVMIQGIAGAFCVRIPVAFLMQRFGGCSLFLIGLSTPCATVVQILMCFVFYRVLAKKEQKSVIPMNMK